MDDDQIGPDAIRRDDAHRTKSPGAVRGRELEHHTEPGKPGAGSIL
jgi:hypothetical protein